MRTLLGCLLGVSLLVGEVHAMPAFRQAKLPALVENAKIICNEDGRCFRPPVRKPVARWVYGDNNFVGPYVGPGYYGNPRYRYRWWPFW